MLCDVRRRAPSYLGAWTLCVTVPTVAQGVAIGIALLYCLDTQVQCTRSMHIACMHVRHAGHTGHAHALPTCHPLLATPYSPPSNLLLPYLHTGLARDVHVHRAGGNLGHRPSLQLVHHLHIARAPACFEVVARCSASLPRRRMCGMRSRHLAESERGTTDGGGLHEPVGVGLGVGLGRDLGSGSGSGTGLRLRLRLRL